MKALIISANNFEDSELLVPYYRLKEAGIEVTVASLKRGVITGKQGYEVAVDKTLDEVNPEDYAILVLPGGKAPAVVRKEPKALEIAQSFFVRNKPVAAICHGPQILISAGLLNGRHATCYMSVANELKEAGALYEDREVVVDGNLVTSRQPPDLPAFMRETMKQLGLQRAVPDDLEGADKIEFDCCGRSLPDQRTVPVMVLNEEQEALAKCADDHFVVGMLQQMLAPVMQPLF